jgi:hypothetical protein
MSKPKADFYAQIEYLAAQNCSIETLYRFIAEIESADKAIEQNTYTWPLAQPSRHVRKYGPTKTFRYLVYYIVTENGIPLIIEYSGPGRQARWRKRL